MVPRGDQHTYKVIFLGVADNSAEARESFVREISEHFHISGQRVEHLLDNPPIVLKKGLSMAKAEALARTLESLGGRAECVTDEEVPRLELEFEAGKTSFLQLESLTSSSKSGRIEVIGRVKNISSHPLRGVKAVAQFFDSRDQLIIYEESPTAFGILRPDQLSPFRVTGGDSTGVNRISIAFKGEDGAMIEAQASCGEMTPPEGNSGPEATGEAFLGRKISRSTAIKPLLDQAFSCISKDAFTQADVEEVLRRTFPKTWATLERENEGVHGGSTREYLAEALSGYVQEQGSSIESARISVESPPGWGIPKMAVYKKVGSALPPSPRVPLSEFDGKSPLRNFACPRISKKSSSNIAKAIIKGYNEEKIPHDLRNFNHLGFNAKSLVSEEDTLVRFLSLVLFDRWPFRPWELVWDEEDGSINSLLRNQGLFRAGEIRRASLHEIEYKLRKCVLKVKGGLWLHTDGCKIRFARTLKELSLHVVEIASSMRLASKESEIMRLHGDIMNIHGFNAVISARCVAYAVRELGTGRTSPEMFEPVAQYLREQWRASDWGERLELPLLGGRPHLFDKIIDQLSDDPLAFDYLYLLGPDYCQDGNCEHCALS